MGNSSSSSSSSSNPSYGKKKYIPSDGQCILLCQAMRGAYVKHTSQWPGVDRDMLLLKLITMLQDSHPEIDSIIKEMFVTPATKKKKRKLSLPAPAAVNDPTFQGIRMPKEVLAMISKCCNRSDCNSFGQTCKAAHQVIEDPRYGVLKMWPTKAVSRPSYHRPHDNGRGDVSILVVRSIVFTRDGSRAAIMYGSSAGSARMYRKETWVLAVLDRSIGLIGEWECYGDMSMVPVFSPDGQLLLCGRISLQGEGIEVEAFQLPSDLDQQGLAVTSLDLGGINRCFASLSFLTNNTAASMNVSENASVIPVHQINRDNTNISFKELNYNPTDPHNIVLPVEGDRGRAAYYSDEKIEILAIVYYFKTKLVFHDRKRNVSVTMKTPDSTGQYLEPVFSHNGKLLVVAASKWGEHGDELCLYDLDVERIESIGQPRLLSFHDGSNGRYVGLSFSPDNKKIIARFHYDYPEDLPEEDTEDYELEDDEFQVIDIEKGEIIAEGWNDATWGTIVS